MAPSLRIEDGQMALAGHAERVACAMEVELVNQYLPPVRVGWWLER